MRFTFALASAAAVFNFSSVLLADDAPYRLKIERSSEQVECLASNDWSGEYPGPVINVSSRRAGTTTIKAFKSLRVLDERVSCTIANGLYNPWGNGRSARIYYYISGVEDYVAIADTEVEEVGSVRQGERIENVVYQSEGHCDGKLVLADSSTKLVSFLCSEVLDHPDLRQVRSPDARCKEQWIYLSCGEGYNAFVKDRDLLAQPGIKLGNFVRYGEVSE